MKSSLRACLKNRSHCKSRRKKAHFDFGFWILDFGFRIQSLLTSAPTILRHALSWSVLLAISLTGCTTKSEAKAQARAAYAAGQQQALERALQSRNSVTILGPVRNPLVPWTEDLTLAKALVAADYYPKTNPREIFIVRQGRAIPVDVNHLLGGEDVPLQAGDVVNIR